MDRLPIHHRGLLVGLGLLTVLLYAPTAAPWVYEDELWLARIDQPVTWSAPPTRALTTWSYQVTGADPQMARAGNLGVHLMNGLLVYGIGAALVSPLVGVAAAGLLWLHPLNSEAVAYATGRSDLLLTFGVLLATWGLLGSWRRLPALLVGLAVALLSKELAVLVVPPLLAVTVWIFRPALRRLVIAVAVGLVVGLTVTDRWPPFAAWFDADKSIGWGAWLAWQNTAVWGLLVKVVTLQGFSIDHDWWAVDRLWVGLAAFASLEALVAIVAFWQFQPRLAWALLWVLIVVAPRYAQRSAEVVLERHLYLAVAGLSVVLGAALVALLRIPVPLTRKDALA